MPDTETLRSAEFAEACELGLLIREMLAAGRATGDLDRNAVVYVVGAEGQVLQNARLVREVLTDGSPVFNLVIS